ncbi:MAG TPA: hypothetical protein DEQ61_08400 [Streptomyces sp.]|nr:hypothetical protein [Streptomyces sp.]
MSIIASASEGEQRPETPNTADADRRILHSAPSDNSDWNDETWQAWFRHCERVHGPTAKTAARGQAETATAVPCGRAKPHLPHDENSDGHYPCPGVPQPTEPLSPERLAEIRDRVAAATRCPEAVVNGREDGGHTWGGSSFTHAQCELCRFSRPRGERVEETATLLAELDRTRAERDAWRDQRNQVFQTNERLLEETGQEQVARLLAENEARTVTRERNELRARVAELDRTRAETIALPSEWDCSHGPLEDESFCSEVPEEEGGHTPDKCPMIHVHREDAEKFAAKVDRIHELQARVAELERAAVEGRAALASLCHDLPDPGTAALGALWLLQQATVWTDSQPDEATRVLEQHDAAVREKAADDFEASCPEHGDGDTAFMDCHCPAADELRRKTDTPEGGPR